MLLNRDLMFIMFGQAILSTQRLRSKPRVPVNSRYVYCCAILGQLLIKNNDFGAYAMLGQRLGNASATPALLRYHAP
jgi:hypothetical protein